MTKHNWEEEPLSQVLPLRKRKCKNCQSLQFSYADMLPSRPEWFPIENSSCIKLEPIPFPSHYNDICSACGMKGEVYIHESVDFMFGKHFRRHVFGADFFCSSCRDRLIEICKDQIDYTDFPIFPAQGTEKAVCILIAEKQRETVHKKYTIYG